MDISISNKRWLLDLARKVLAQYFETGGVLKLYEEEVPKVFLEQRATFVTLTKMGELRGCVGKLMPINPIYIDVIENALSAAFEDTRFFPLTKAELSEIEIEISILDLPKKIDYSNAKELLKILKTEKPGVIIQYESYSSTFLPQVWEDISDEKEFLTHLCLKAGLSGDFWKQNKLEVKTYNVTNFSE